MKTKPMLQLTILTAILWAANVTASARQIEFSGLQWTVRNSGGNLSGPGPNYWSDSTDNVWVDSNGYLHLKITHTGTGATTKWYCPQVISNYRFAKGAYQFWIIGRIDDLDPNVVFGLFQYPTADVGENGTDEIDFEFSRWGVPGAPNALYTVYPKSSVATGGIRVAGQRKWTFDLDDSYPQPWTTYRYTRQTDRIYFQSLYGHQDGNVNMFDAWTYWEGTDTYTPNPGDVNHSVAAMPVFFNLWRFNGQPVADTEVVIRAFKYTSCDDMGPWCS